MNLFAQFSRRPVAILAILAGTLSARPLAAKAQFSFAPPVPYAAGAAPQALATADLNRDGLPDVVVGTGTGINVLLNSGNGTFGTPTSYATGGTSTIVAADLNDDGISDIAYGLTPGPRVVVLLSRGDGTFEPANIYGLGNNNRFATSIVSGDFFHAGRTDLAVVAVGLFGLSPSLTFFRNESGGTFSRVQEIGLTGGAVGATSGDFDNDGDSDIATANGNINGTTTMSVLLNINGAFGPSADKVVNSHNRIRSGDLNNDGAPDLVLFAGDASWVTVCLNLGGGTFGAPTLYSTGYFPADAAIADFDGDGNNDVAAFVVGGSPFPVVILQGQGDGTLAPPTIIATFPNHSGSVLAAVDIDSNGAVDLMTSDNAATAVHAIINLSPPPVDHGLLMSTDHGGNTGTVTLTLFGSGIQAGATASMVCPGQPAINGVVSVVREASLTASFDLSGVAPATCSVVLTLPDGRTLMASKAFRIEAGGAPEIEIDIVGFDRIRIGRTQTYYIAVSNTGNVDARFVPLWLTFPKGVKWELGVRVSDLPLSEIGLGSLDLTKYPKYLETDTDVAIPIFATHVALGSTTLLPFTLTIPGGAPVGSVRVQSWVQVCQFASPLSPQWKNCLEAAFDNFVLQLLPVYGCAAALNQISDTAQKLDTAIRTNELQNRLFVYQLDQYFALANASINCTTDAALVLGPEGLIVKESIKLLPPALAVNSYQTFRACQDALTPKAQRDIFVAPVASFDPNEKTGPLGTGPLRYLAGIAQVPYAVFFENKESASAPAQDVSILDHLDVTKVDLTTFSFGPIRFGGTVVTPPPFQTTFATTVDLRPAQKLLVALNAQLNISTGLLTWTFKSLDPATGSPPADPTAGFLPPGGGGSVFFTVAPRPSLATGTPIQNQASIVFDTNEAIVTQVWTNTIDKDRPRSSIVPLAVVQTNPTFIVAWQATDAGSGVKVITLYSSEEGGPFVAVASDLTGTSTTFTGVPGRTYSFYTLARDQVGNAELPKTMGEGTTAVIADAKPPTINVAASPSALWPPNGQTVSVKISGVITDAGSGLDRASVTFEVVDEYGSHQPSGKVMPAADGSYSFLVPLEASRRGNDTDGRLYMIAVRARDAAGNEASSATSVVVPRDKGR